jgi:hypothetical protein
MEGSTLWHVICINCQGLWFGNGVCFICCWRHRAKDNFEGRAMPVRMPPRRLYLKTSLITRMKMNKSNKVKMNKFKILSVAFLATVSGMNAQDIDQAKKGD